MRPDIVTRNPGNSVWSSVYKIRGLLNNLSHFSRRLDSGEDQRVDKEEFTSEKMKETIEKVSRDQMVREVVFTEST